MVKRMSIRLVSVTPLARRWPHELGELTRGIRIIERPTFSATDWRFWDLRRTEEETILGQSHWLSIESECEWNMADTLRAAMLGVQVWSPIGWHGLILDCIRTDEGLLGVERVHKPERYAVPSWGRMIDLCKVDPLPLRCLVEGTLAADQSGCVPLVNPFRFFEIGLQTAVNHRRAGAVLWVMGLDALLGAEKQAVFSRRLQKLLGPDTRIFPEDWVGRKPKYTVADLAEDVFEFRSLIAHGRKILDKFRDPIKFQFETEDLASLGVERWSRGTLMIESIVFTLIAALRKVIIDGLIDGIKHQRQWKKWLDAPL